ncbi:arsenate reductase (glutaredoxin) [Candidatus Marinarcus aquaticus]|uniref:Arsenate reductase (Glutaredoxin) n=1 Tax=Candidatus Marinarcus aquaticus TaxID=2044504 RepID=A0A4Q0XS78_9BACT|nr:arsenate reductase (glutaredoxin) [Candidatus Marinarcus aquaticus]RXJ60246.1 arsenate reductase (glutaredoxin) [Candidatus Marinarcus aquaticus]
MSQLTILHNPRCSKSRNALQLLEDNKCDFKVIPYLEATPNKQELSHIIKLLGIKPSELLRTGEDIYKELNLKNEHDEDKILDAMVAHPKLIERPIVIKGDKAVIGRPLENVKELIK